MSQAVRARSALNAYYSTNLTTSGCLHRDWSTGWNGKTWRTYDLAPAEEALLSSGVTLQGDKAGQANALVIGTLAHASRCRWRISWRVTTRWRSPR